MNGQSPRQLIVEIISGLGFGLVCMVLIRTGAHMEAFDNLRTMVLAQASDDQEIEREVKVIREGQIKMQSQLNNVQAEVQKTAEDTESIRDDIGKIKGALNIPD